MTGGSLPAMIWKQIMSYAHQGIEIKPIPGVAPGPTPPTVAVAVADANASGSDALRPTVLTKRAVDVLLRIERIFDDTVRAQKPAGAASLDGPAAVASSERKFGSTPGRN
jgi:penicillin-binding protein 1A